MCSQTASIINALIDDAQSKSIQMSGNQNDGSDNKCIHLSLTFSSAK